MSQVAHQAVAYIGFCTVKQLGVFLFPPGWDASLLQGYPQNEVCQYLFTCIHLSKERHCESKLSCPRTQHIVLTQDWNLDHLTDPETSTLIMRLLYEWHEFSRI